MILIDLIQENFSYIYIYNIIMILPEVLSYSRINYLNIFNLTQLFTPRRDVLFMIFTCIIIILSYNMINIISKEREFMQGNLNGVEKETILKNNIIHANYSVIFGGSVFIITSIILLLNLVIDSSLSSLKILPSYYIIYGVTSFALLIGYIFIFLKRS